LSGFRKTNGIFPEHSSRRRLCIYEKNLKVRADHYATYLPTPTNQTKNKALFI